jgi:TetR/AcrR family transcriptional regulator, transcriptional repressor of aconitase
VPKVSEAHKQRRREQILDGARRCFGQYGYEGATVARLEQETGLSRGAIFNYFESKDALFVELALETSRRLTDVWLQQGFHAVLEAIAHEDADWLSVQFEATRRVRTDPAFRQLIEGREKEVVAERGERLERLRPHVRDDVPVEQAAMFLALVVNGLALRQSLGDPMPDLDVIAKLADEGVAPRQSSP